MDGSLSSWLVIAVALVLANLPFVTESVFGIIPLKGKKGAWTRVLELLVLYFVTGAVAYALEARIGNVFTQVREFYMITVPLFVVLGFPGFVYRYLRKQHG
jgi:ABC-type proline/glycine betaine transport system permease subunit